MFAALVLAACGDGPQPPAQEPGGRGQPSPQPDLPRGTLVIRTDQAPVRIDVEIAETPEHKARGLMGRRSLPENAGMVFLEEEPVTTSFWMKDTLIPLSIAYMERTGDRRFRILRVMDMDPCPPDTDCPTYDPGLPYDAALEVNQRWFGERDLGPGATGVVRGDLPTAS